MIFFLSYLPPKRDNSHLDLLKKMNYKKYTKGKNYTVCTVFA